MEITTPQGITVAALTLMFVAGMVPMGSIGAQAAEGCLDNAEFPGYITLSNPLVGKTSASELVYFMANGQDGALAETNGIDAYVIDLECQNTPALHYDLDRTRGQEGDHEFHVRYFDASINQVGETDGEVNKPILDEQVPLDTRYVVIELEQGPLVNGFEASHGPGFYSVAFMFSTHL